MKTSHFFLSSLATLSLLGSPILHADDWANWRGPNHNGASSEEGEFPSSFSRTKNVKWKAELPGVGASTPIVSGDAIFLTSADKKENGIIAMQVDAKSGEVVWSKKFGEGVSKDPKSTYSGPSPTTDGKVVIFFTGNGELAAFDFDGNEIWKRDIQKDYGQFAFGWTFSTSPLLHKGMLYLQVLQRDTAVDGRGFTDKKNESYLLALNPADGKEIFKVERDSNAVVESREAFTSPIPVTHDGREEITVVGGDVMTGHDPKTGQELWRWGTWNPDLEKYWRLVPSPVYGEGILLACAPKGQPVYAINAGGVGDLDDTALAWVNDEKQISSDVPTPLFYDGHFYIVNGRQKFISCVEPVTGKVLYTERLAAKQKIESSPTAVDGKIYLMSHLGEVFVIKAGPEFKLLNSTTMASDQSTNIRASVVPANGNLFIRTDNTLYCIGE